MPIALTDLQCKEVICIANGQRLGFVSDIQIDVPDGKVRAIIVPCPCKYLGLGRREDFVIPWSCIQRIGPDIVLVDTKPDDCRCQRIRPGHK